MASSVHLCGHKFAPIRDPQRFPVCPKCKELAGMLGRCSGAQPEPAGEGPDQAEWSVDAQAVVVDGRGQADAAKEDEVERGRLGGDPEVLSKPGCSGQSETSPGWRTSQ